MKRVLKAFMSLALLCFMAAAVLVSCGKEEFTFSFKDGERIYFTGDSVNCYDFFDKESGVRYVIEVEDASGEKHAVEGQTYYADVPGNYKLYVTADKNGKTSSAVKDFSVVDVPPFMLLYGKIDLPLGISLTQNALIGRLNPFIYCEADYSRYFSSITVYKNFGEGKEKFDITDDKTNEYYDGTRFNFISEGKYVLHFVCENAGGKSEADAVAEVREDFSSIPDIENAEISYDSVNKTVTWEKIEGAEYYRVKLASDIIVEVKDGATSLDIGEYLPHDFSYFDLYVVAVGKNEERIGKLCLKDMIIPPEGFEGMVLCKNAEIDLTTREVTMNTYDLAGRNVKMLDEQENDYVAFGLDYGVGTYIDTEFKGNNMPTIKLFSNKINGLLSSINDKELGVYTADNKGLTLINGFISTGTGNHASAPDGFSIYGPDNLGTGYYLASGSGVIGYYDYGFDSYNTDYSALTMKAIMEAGEDAEYKYTVGTRRDVDDTLRVHIIFSRKTDGEWRTIYNFEHDTNCPVSDFEAGKIVLLGNEKGAGTIKFKVSQPYEGEGVSFPRENMSGLNAEFSGENTVKLRSRVVNSGKITRYPLATTSLEEANENIAAAQAKLDEAIAAGADDATIEKLKNDLAYYKTVPAAIEKDSAGFKLAKTTLQSGNDIDGEERPFIAFLGDYGVGYYVDFEFVGDNQPAVKLLATKPNGYFTSGALSKLEGNDGIAFIGGFNCKTSRFNDPTGYQILPHLITANYGLVNSMKGYLSYSVPKMTTGGLKNNPDTRYKYTVGTFEDSDGTVVAHAMLYKKVGEDWVLVHTLANDTNVPVSEYTGGNIVAGAAYKEDGYTVFEYGEPYLGRDSVLVGHNAVISGEGEVTLTAKNIKTNTQEQIDGNNYSYVGFNGKYGVGTYIDTEFVGNNMPIIKLFASSFDGNITKGVKADTSGILLINGLVNGGKFQGKPMDETSVQNGYFRIYYDCMPADAGWTAWPANVTGGGDAFINGMEMTALANTPDTRYKYTVGTKKDEDGTLIVEAYLWKYEGDALSLVAEVHSDTGKPASEFKASSIMLIAAAKGANKQNVFKITGEPYAK